MQIYVNSMNKSSILLMVLDWLTAQCSMGRGDARYIWIFRIFYARRIFNSWDKTWDKICIFWGEVAGGDILRPKFDCRLFWEVDEGARPLGEHLKGFECEQISLILLKTSLILTSTRRPQRGWTGRCRSWIWCGRNPKCWAIFFRMFLSLLGENSKIKLSISK